MTTEKTTEAAPASGAGEAITADRSECLLFLQGIVGGWARWEPFQGSRDGEVCVGGLRYYTRLGEDGLPLISGIVVGALWLAKRAAAQEGGR